MLDLLLGDPWGETGSHSVTMDPKVETAFFTSSTLPAENLNTGETEDCLGN